MNQSAKRILSFVLCLAMLVGLFPAYAIGADAAETVLDAAIFCSDVHGSTSDLTSVMSGVKTSGVDYSSIGFVGDTCLTVANATSTVQSALGDTDISVMFSYAASHDTENSADIGTNWNYSGEVEGVSDYYLVYTIRETDMETSSGAATAAPAFTTWYSGLTEAQKKLPIFIMSHRPLHARRDDNDGAASWYDAISAAAASSDIVFFWAHNHTGETEVDTDAYYVAKNGDETISVQGGSTVTPNFTYMNAGYINANGQNPARINVATTVQITESNLIFQDYTTSGAYSGTYAHNVEVTREFAGSTDSGDSDGSTEETTEPTEGETTTETKEVYVLVDTMTVGEDYLIANGNSGTVTLLGQSGGSAATTSATVTTSGDYTYIETADSGYVWNATAHTNSSYSSYPRLINAETYAMYASSGSLVFGNGLTDTSGAIYTRYWTYSDGQLACASTNSGSTTYYLTYSDGYSMTSTATDGIYIYEKQTITVSSDGTVSGGDSGSTDEGGDDTTGGSTETVVGDATVITADDESYQKVTFGSTTTEKKTVYILTSSISSGNAYLIANSNSAGSAYVVANNSGSVAATGVTVVVDDTIGTYIELDDATDELWTTSGSSSTTLKNGSYYLYPRTKDSGSLELRTESRNWSYSNNRLSYSNYYLYYSNGWDVSSTQNSVYFYVPTEVDVIVGSEVTYSVTASDIEHFYTADTTDTETVTITKSVTDGTPDGTYTYEIVEGGDDIITSVSEDGIITFNGAEGTAQVKVSYSWTDGENTYTIWQVIDVTATSPYYTLDLHKADIAYTEATGLTEFADGTIYYIQNEDGTYTQVSSDATFDSSETYYTLSYTLGDEITAPIAIKGIEEGDRYGVWAVVTYYDGTTEDGTDMGTVGDDIEWSSSDETIATVDKNTGIITFTGKEGTVNITATYLNGNKPADTITISVTQSLYSVPADGTNDFPEYPNEGAIRYDKTAVAVGNFSETGIAQVELSMTGVPYTTGSELDVVLMLDITGSMTDVTISSYTYSKYARVEYTILASQAFVESIVVNEDGSYNGNRVGVYSFNSGGTYTLFDLGTISSDDELTDAKAAIATLYDDYKSGGTPYDDGLSKVQSVLSTAKTDGTGNNRQQFAIFMTDGVPTDYEYITGSTHANFSSASDIAGMLTSSDNYSTRDTDYKYEYYSTEMKGDGITVYTVGIGLENKNSAWSSGDATDCLNLASRLLNDISGPANETTQPDAVGTSTLSKKDSYFFSVADADAATEMENVFSNIAQKILQAATNVTVEDKITDEYTMIFDLPEGTKDITGLDSQEFYIEFVKYALDENHERTDDVTTVTKLYLGTSNGSYYAASDASGNAYDAPVFAQTTIGEKGTLYYWTTDDTYASKAAVTYTNSDDTYYFIPYGMEENEDGTAPDGWYNMTSGAYAYGTVDSTNMSQNLVIATPYFVYNAESKMLYWTVDKLDTAEYALRYFLYLNNSATEVGTNDEVDAATYPTNDHAYITYTNFRGNDCRQVFPIPRLTWNGAQVSYVFYLVNAQGQPINKSGQVVDFANAVFVTDVYTKAVVWNKGVDGSTGTGELSADWLADELLPDEYTIYDELAGFELNVHENADGTTIKNQFTIEGDTAANISSSLNTRLDLETTESTVSVTTTKVYNTKAGQKVTGYGTYYSTDANMAGIDFANTTVAFAVVWESKLVPDVVVVDYGLDVLINVVQNDLLQNTISGIGVGNSAYGDIAMNTGVIGTSQLGTAALTMDGNTISIENENAVRFHQGDMEFAAPVKFYYESPVKFYEDSEQKTGYMYSSVTVIPATTIYYEDEYVTLKTYEVLKNEDGTIQTDDYGNPIFDTVGTSGWDTSSVAASATQQQDRPGVSQIAAALDADNNYGYDAAYAEMSSHSMGNAAMINVNAYKKGEATFTFYGTGFDIISVTSNMTGTLMVQVTGTTASGASYRKNLMVDTYYGYTQNADGEWVTSVNDPNALYQVPVIKLGGLEYGQYTVKLVAAYSDAFAHDSADNYDLYLDAIRIYDPTGNNNDVANNAYKADGEGWPIYKELRNLVIEANTFGSYLTVDSEGSSEVQVDGAVFIDSDDSTSVISDYISYGPNNELYLAAGQAVAFEIADVFEQDVEENPAAVDPVKVQLAIKTVGTSDAKVEIFNPSISTSTTTDGDTQTTTKTFVKGNLIAKTISTATDMYYDITALTDDVIVISNPGTDGIISITNLKFTFEEAASVKTVTTTNEDGTEETSEASVASISEEGAVYSLRSLRAYSVSETTEVETEATEPETTEPETEATEPETTEPETEATEPETTEPETEATEPETTEPETEETTPETTEPEDDNSGSGTSWSDIIKKLLGWLFG